MKWQLNLAIIAAIGFVIGAPAVAQPGGPLGDRPIIVTVQLGTAAGEMVITPRDVVFEKGQRYKLILTNPSNVEHLFSVRAFSRSVVTYDKPEIDKGVVIGKPHFTGRVPSGYFVREIDIAPGGTAEWEFKPLWSRVAKVGCRIDSHAQAGMTSTFGVI